MNHGAGGLDSIGRDGTLNTPYANVAADAFAYNLSYHTDDYKPISSNFAYDITQTDANRKQILEGYAPSLYNGNIRAMWGGLDKFAFSGNNNALPPAAQGQYFKYDQLNRLLQANDYVLKGQNLTNAQNNYGMSLTYDPNGNILSLSRNGVKNNILTAMDNLTYTYQTATNKLTHVDDNVNKGNYDNDIDDQDPNNYTYDAIGNLIKDNAEEIENMVVI